MRRAYEDWSPDPATRSVVRQVNDIVADYSAQGYDLTLRQLYYQFVSRDLIPNSDRSYKRLGSIVNRGRLAGLIDWSAIVDRTRNLAGLGHHEDPAGIIATTVRAFHLDRWSDQPTRVEVWVEKEALAGVVDRAASSFDVDWFSCRGYVSQSELWGAARRHLGYLQDGQRVVVLHLGDHDPSGIDMTRDITDRLRRFILTDWVDEWSLDYPEILTDESDLDDVEEEIRSHLYECGNAVAIEDDETDEWTAPFEVRRIALNMDQVRQYAPPPNPAKLTDSRSSGYVERYGSSSWELDALDPATLSTLIGQHVRSIVDADRYDAKLAEQTVHRDNLRTLSTRYAEVVEFLGRES